jgi:hypothetical protein
MKLPRHVIDDASYILNMFNANFESFEYTYEHTYKYMNNDILICIYCDYVTVIIETHTVHIIP